MGELGDTEVESGIVNENHHVRLPAEDVRGAVREPFGEGSDVEQNLGEADDGPILVVLHEAGSLLMLLIDGIHKPSAPEADVSLGVLSVKPPHKIGSVQIPGRLSGYDIVAHIL